MSHLTNSINTSSLYKHIVERNAIAINDGSYFPHNQLGSCTLIISTPDGKEWIKGGGIIPGAKFDQSAYRNELGGQLDIASIVSNLILPDGVQSTLTIACDGLSVLEKTRTTKLDFKVTGKYIYSMSITSELLTTSSFNIKPKHVYGHQGNLNRPLTFMEKLNYQMHSMAKPISLEYIQGTSHTTLFHTTKLGYGSSNIRIFLLRQKYNHHYTTILFMMICVNYYPRSLTLILICSSMRFTGHPSRLLEKNLYCPFKFSSVNG